MIEKPWLQVKNDPQCEYVVIRPGRDSYLAWTLIWLGCVSILCMGYTSSLIKSVADRAPILISLAIALTLGCSIKLIEVCFRSVRMDRDGVKINVPFYRKYIAWDHIATIEWWPLSVDRQHAVFYNLRGKDQESIVIFGDDSWKQLHEGINFAIRHRGIQPVLADPPATVLAHWVLRITLSLLVVSLFFMPQNIIWRILDLALFRVFWLTLTNPLSEYDRQKAWFYIMLMAIVNIAVLGWLFKADLNTILLWWLYSPFVELTFHFLFIELPNILGKSKGQQD